MALPPARSMAAPAAAASACDAVTMPRSDSARLAYIGGGDTEGRGAQPARRSTAMNAAGRMESIMAGRRFEVQRNRQSEGRENRHSEVRRHRYNEDRARHVVPDPVECRANTRVRRLCTPAPAPGPPSVLELEERLELGEPQQLANAGWRVGEVGGEVTLTRPLLHQDEHAESAGIDLARLAKIAGDPPVSYTHLRAHET